MALKLGIVNVDRDILRGLTAKQLRGWEHFFELEPFGELRDDYRAASIREMVFNVNVQAKDRRPLKEFLLSFGEADEKPRKTENQMEQIARMIVAAYNAPGVDK